MTYKRKKPVIVDTPRLMTPGEAAAAYGVDSTTLRRWANAGKILSIKTPGGHRRYSESEIKRNLSAFSPGDE